ncbi:hypothetical protein R3P38DRAFT_3171073 [Favolaschia claudopus]|uniref:Protein-S-isoprenylcysteine O-methyltransferase n=1 Tax=Favolaschia claudopus TaxID=2862362 RepID=A0AAW0DQT9_9AGAR
MSFSKMLVISATTLSLHISSTSPNPPLRKSERTIERTTFEFILVSPALRLMQKTQAFYWGSAIAEAAIIIASSYPPSTLSQSIITVFALGGEPPSSCLNRTLFLGSFLTISGALVRILSYSALGKYFTFEAGISHDHILIKTGPYSLVRHPGYAGAVLAYLGLLVYYASPGSWFIECALKGSVIGFLSGTTFVFSMSLVVAGLLSRISKEEARLQSKFGLEWDMWAARVPYILVPCIY